MLLPIVMNIDGWYNVPVSFDQTISGILMASSLIVITSLVEEAENIRYFGAQCREYMKRTKRFIPFVA